MPNPIDIYDQHNQPTGKTTSIDSVMKHGWWHRGVHVIVYTDTGYVLVQKRSNTMVMHPGYLDISCGGFVDSRETPEQAAVREVHEELGLRLPERSLEFLYISRQNHALPRTKRADRTFQYCYGVRLPSHDIDLSHLQTEEVSWAGFVPLQRTKRLVQLHRLKSLGRLEPRYSLYRHLLEAVKITATS